VAGSTPAVRVAARPSKAAQQLDGLSTRGLRERSPGLSRLDSGDPDFDPPADAMAAMLDSVALGSLNQYGPPLGLPELREAIAADLATRWPVAVHASQILLTHGASGALAAALGAVIDPGDRVIIPNPTYSILVDSLRLAGAEPIYVPDTTDGALDLNRIEATADSARAILFCNPCSPTGKLYSRAELHAVSEIAMERGLAVISDEVYDRIVFSGSEFTSTLAFPDLSDNLLYVQSFSKTFSMSGFRLGYLVAPERFFPLCSRVQRTIHGPLNQAVQQAALAALGTEDSWITERRDELETRRDAMVAALSALPGTRVISPEAGLFTWLQHSANYSSTELTVRARDAGVLIRAGSEFGAAGDGQVAVSFAVGGEELEVGVARLMSVLEDADCGVEDA
jgi:aspartate/methionine/tyrosine aminotransferase